MTQRPAGFVPRSAFLRTLAIPAADECDAESAHAVDEFRTAARNFACCSPATPSTSVPSFSRGWNDSYSVRRQQGWPLFSLWSVRLWQSHWLENAGFEAHIGGMSESDRRACHCGAIYHRTKVKAVSCEINRFECELCGTIIESWNSTWVPRYRLIAGLIRGAK